MRAPKPRRWIVNPAGSLERTPQDPDAATGGGADATDAATRPRPTSAPRMVRRLPRKRSADGAVICQRGMRRGSERAQTRDAPVVLVGADVVHDRRHRGLSCAARAGVALERPAVNPPAEPPPRRQLRNTHSLSFPTCVRLLRVQPTRPVKTRRSRCVVCAYANTVIRDGFFKYLGSICAKSTTSSHPGFYDSSDGNGGYAPGVSMAKKALAPPKCYPRSALPPPSSPSSHRAAPSPSNTGATLSAM